jgi:hypothetical protein
MAKKKIVSIVPKAKLLAKSRKPRPVGNVYQFKITLEGSDPPIWRRIQVQDCTLDSPPLVAASREADVALVADHLDALWPRAGGEFLEVGGRAVVRAVVDQHQLVGRPGMLTAAERREYETIVDAIDFIAILQAKGRALVRRSANGR